MSDNKPPETSEIKKIIEKIELLEQQKAQTADDIKEIYLLAKANGFDVPTIKTIIKIRKEDQDERQEKQELLEIYLDAIGMKV